MIKVYGVCLSPFVRKIYAALRLKHIPYETETVLPGVIEPEYLKISPLGKIPALVDGDLNLADSTVIAEYLEEKYSEISLLPESPEDRAIARWIEEYSDTKILETLTGGIFFQKTVKPRLMNQEPDQERVERSLAAMPEILNYLETLLPESGFIFGKITIADISIATHFINGEYGGFTVDSKEWPRVASLVETFKAYPVIAEILYEEQQAFPDITT